MKLVKINNKLISKSKILLLLFLMLYAFIPFETGGSPLAYKIHMFFLMLITLFALFISNFRVKMNQLGIITIFASIFAILIMILVNDGVYGPKGILVTTTFIFAFITASVIQNNANFRTYFLLALKWLIIISILLLFVQISTFTLAGNLIHFHEMLFPFSEARIGTDRLFEGLYRMGGLYIEPGTYANWMYVFLLLYMILSKKIYSPLIMLGSISIIFSYSTWGMVFGTFLLILSLLAKFRTSSWSVKGLVMIAFLSMGYFYVGYFAKSEAVSFAMYKLTTGNASTEGKIEAYEVFVNNIENFLFTGEGFEPKIFIGIGSTQDAGIVLNLAVVFGVLFTVVILFIYIFSYFKCCNVTMLIASLPIFLGKLYFYDPAFWLLIFIVIYGGYSNNKNRGRKQ